MEGEGKMGVIPGMGRKGYEKVGTEVMSSHTGEPAALLSNASVPTIISVADLFCSVKLNRGDGEKNCDGRS